MSSELLNQYVNHYQGEKYPGLPRLDYMRRYLDGLVSILEGYLMTFSTILITIGISFSMYDFLSGGTALNDPNVFKIWAIVQTIAIDAQFVNMWYRLKVSLREGKRWQAGGYLVLGVTLAFVTFGASVIPALQKSLGLNFDAAILQAGLNPTAMIWARSFVAILLAIIGAFQRTVIVFDKTGQIKNTEQELNTPTPVKQPGFFARTYAQITTLLAEKSDRTQDPKEAVTDGSETVSRELTQKAQMEDVEVSQPVDKEIVFPPDEDETDDDIDLSTDTPLIDDITAYLLRQEKDTGDVASVSTDRDTEPRAKVTRQLSTKVSTKQPVAKGRDTARTKALRILKKHPGIGPTELAQKAQITRQYASKIIAETA